jgi:RimJ/RimL family protein N-acetyltransferase
MSVPSNMPFVPNDFVVPRAFDCGGLRLRPLDVMHNERDYAAWTSSMDHIKATPGFVGEAWPHPMSLVDNERDLARHAADFEARRGFTFTVLDRHDDVVGCLYIYPPRDAGHDARVASWMRASHAALDRALYDCVVDWLERAWPFRNPEYAART